MDSSVTRARMTSALVLGLLSWTLSAQPAPAQSARLPVLAEPVNDFAGVIDGPSEREMDRLIRALQAATGDVVIVVTIDTFQPDYGDIRDYANELYENHGRGIGEKGKDNGLLILLAVKDRRVWVEVGYGLEQFITDGLAGETSRQVMTPHFRAGDYGAGLLAGVRALGGRIAEARGVSIDELPPPGRNRSRQTAAAPSLTLIVLLLLFVFLILVIANASHGRSSARSRRGRDVYWGGGPWSGWGGGGYGGTFGGGGGFSGGFGGFGGGGSGGGGGGSSW
jgi:uncharacterized protein